jgi:hypothetical protein
MATNKKGFMLYADQQELFNQLSNEQAGQLIKHVFSYVNDENPKTDSLIINLAFTPIKQQLKRDLIKWEASADRSRINGAKGGRPPKQNKPSGLIDNPEEPKEPDTVNVTVNDTVTVKDKVTNNINIRETEFKNSLQPFLEEFGSDTLNNFYLYWTEKKPKGRKMLFEMQKTFDIRRRLDRWNKNNFNNKEKSSGKKEKVNAGLILQRKYGIS